MKIAWATDIHLNFLKSNEREKFYSTIKETNLDALFITGDIAEAPSLKTILQEISAFVQKPVYFVLGNHDYYRSTIELVREEITTLSKKENLLNWLPATGPCMLNHEVILLGQDGWADGRLGNFQKSPVSLVDSRLIADLFQQKILGKNHLLEKMQQLADEDAKNLHLHLKQAIEQRPKKIIVLTHVPPFRETSLYENKISDDDYQPYFTSKATGDVLMNMATSNPAVEFLVLCGHTHHKCIYKALENLTVKVGAAEYAYPAVEEVFEI